MIWIYLVFHNSSFSLFLCSIHKNGLWKYFVVVNLCNGHAHIIQILIFNKIIHIEPFRICFVIVMWWHVRHMYHLPRKNISRHLLLFVEYKMPLKEGKIILKIFNFLLKGFKKLEHDILVTYFTTPWRWQA